MQCPTPGRWNRMHYSCLRGAGFEVSVCIMKAERLRIVMPYRSLVIFLSFSVCFSSLCLSLCHCFYHSIPFHSARFSLLFFISFFFFTLLPGFNAGPRERTHGTPSHVVPSVYYVHVSIVGRCDWLKLELLKGHTRARRACVSQLVGYGSMNWYQN